MASPVSAGRVHDTSSPGSVGSLYSVRLSVGALGFPASTSVTLMFTVTLAVFPCTTQLSVAV